MITYRDMIPKDISELYGLWDDLFPHNPISMRELNELLFCHNPWNLSWYKITLNEDHIIGAACGVIDRNSQVGYIQFIGVAEPFRRQGIGSSLLENLLETFRKAGTIKAVFSGFPLNYLVPGLDGELYPSGAVFFRKKQFIPLSHPVAMCLSLVNYSPYSVITAPEYLLIPFADNYLAQILSLCGRSLHPEWVNTMQTAYLKGADSSNGKICLDREGNLVGFAFFGILGNDPKRFGPIGVAPEHRGNSIGMALLHECLKAQKDAGYETSYFLWGEENTIALKMYKKSGFKVMSAMTILQKELVIR
jgi:ribosomal protein S18 acetylase RimI-like enzyme